MSVGQKREKTPRWKFAIIVWIAIYPAVTLAQYILAPVTTNWSIPSRTLVLSLLEVPYAVFFAIPLLQNLFKGWLKSGKWMD